MADRWMDERDRDWRDRDWRRSEAYGRGGEERGRGGQSRRFGEERSWSSGRSEPAYEELSRHPVGYGADEETYDAGSHVSSGGSYGAGPYGGEGYGRGGGGPQSYRTGAEHQRFGGQDYTGRGYGAAQGYRGAQDERSQGYGQRDRYRRRFGEGAWADVGEHDYGREQERRYAGDLQHGGSGAAGGYAFDRDYGAAAPSEQRGRERWEARHEERREEDRGEGAGDFLQRAGERISSWFRGDDHMRGSRDEDRDRERRYREDFAREERSFERGHRGVGPKGYKRSDERISDEVHERLTDDPWLDASDIQVEVKDGEVTLSGHVDNREAKHRAERVIEDLSGVRHVQNNLRVSPTASFTGAGRGFGSSALEAEMRRNEQATDPGNRGVSGLSGRTSTGAEAERSTGAATETSVDPKTGAKRS